MISQPLLKFLVDFNLPLRAAASTLVFILAAESYLTSCTLDKFDLFPCYHNHTDQNAYQNVNQRIKYRQCDPAAIVLKDIG